MLVAAIDTSTLTLSLALCEARDGDVRLVAEHEEPARAGGHGGRLPAALTELLAARGVGADAVDAWVCGLGPGSFTGLRIGLATWKGFAYALKRPLLGASSLAAMALSASSAAPAGAALVPLLDAKKGEVYAGFYRRREGGGVEAVAPEAALSPERLAERAAAIPGALVFGHGYAAYERALSGRVAALAGGPDAPSAEALARLVGPALRAARYEAERVFALEPHYVRPSEAELKFPGGLAPRPP